MNGLSRRELAERAGVDPAFVGRLLEIALLAPTADDAFSIGDLRRVRLLSSLERAGIPLDGIAEAIRGGHLSFDFLDLPNFDRLTALSGKTFQQLSDDTGVPVDLLLTMREAIGFARPSPDDPVREDEMRIVPTIQQQFGHGFSATAVERLLRVYGDSLRRVGETEGDWFYMQFMKPRIDAGMSETEAMLDGSPEAFPFMAPQEQALTAMYHAHQEHAMVKNITEMVESSLERAGVRSRLARPPAMCFLDLAGYTRLTEQQGDEAAAQLAETLSRLVQRISRQHDGAPVKWLGDGVMFYFRDPGRAVVAALEMVARIPEEGLPRARCGLDAGPVVFQEGDYFGRTVNNAARIGAYARPGEVLVSQAVVDGSDVEGLTFNEIGDVELKGIAQPLRLHAAMAGSG